jgi:hypothetical protein
LRAANLVAQSANVRRQAGDEKATVAQGGIE